MSTKILLLAFRTSQRKFFQKLQKRSTKENLFEIVSTKSILFPSISALREIHKVDLEPAIEFAVKEFYAKTDINIPEVVLKFFFTLLSIYNYMRYYKILRKGYQTVLLWNGGKFRQRIAIEIAQKLFNTQVCFYENGFLPNRIVFDKRGINFDNSVPRDQAFYESYTSTTELPRTIIQRRGKREEKFQVLKDPLPSQYIFVPFQVDYDTQIITHSQWVHTMRELFTLIESIAKQTSWNFVLKEHPSSGKNYPDLHDRTKNIQSIQFANGYTTQELIEKSSAVITVNSTVGIEALLFHKKVITLGNAFYNINNISLRASSEEELLELIKNLDSKSIDFALVDKFLQYLYDDYLIPDNSDIYDTFIQRLTHDL